MFPGFERMKRQKYIVTLYSSERRQTALTHVFIEYFRIYFDGDQTPFYSAWGKNTVSSSLFSKSYLTN